MLIRAGLLLFVSILAIITLGAGCGGDPGPNAADGKKSGNSGENAEDFQPYLTIPGYDNRQDDPLDEDIEIAYLSYKMKGDAAKRFQLGSEDSTTQYLLLYSKGWMRHSTFGGPFEGLARRDDVQTYWKEIKKMAYQDLYAFLWKRGFFELPGDRAVDWERFGKDAGFTKAISVDRGGERWVVFLDDVTGEHGDDPRWGVFRDCEMKILSWYSAINDVRPQVTKQGFNKAFQQSQRNPPEDDD